MKDEISRGLVYIVIFVGLIFLHVWVEFLVDSFYPIGITPYAPPRRT
jgi:hypothetical protein